MANIIVFGANGFIGRNLVRALAATKADSIVAFDKFSAYQRDSSHAFESHPNVKVMIGDFFNRGDITNALKDMDYVFHLVSATTPVTSNNDPLIDITNIKGSIELFDACVKAGVKKVVFISSGGTVYGDIDSEKIDELTLPAPHSPYGIGKLTIEHYLRYFQYVSGLKYVVYRVANPYGPGQNIHGKQGVIPIFMHQFLTDSPITIYGKGDMIRDYLYVDDLIEMITTSYAKDTKHPEYNVGSGHGSSVNELVAAIEKCSGIRVPKRHSPTPPTFVRRSVLDINRFVGEFGVKPRTSLEEGIKKTWNYVKEISDQ